MCGCVRMNERGGGRERGQEKRRREVAEGRGNKMFGKYKVRIYT